MQKSEIPERGEVREVKAAEPYRHMMPGMKEETSAEVRIDGGVDRMEGESEEDEEIPTLPTPRKRLLNFKIPLLGGQRRDQQKQMSVVARRRLFTDDSENRGRKALTQNMLPFIIFIIIVIIIYQRMKIHQ